MVDNFKMQIEDKANNRCFEWIPNKSSGNFLGEGVYGIAYKGYMFSKDNPNFK